MTLRGIQGDMALPPSTGAPAKGNDRELAEHRRAWEREMERAQMSAWLAHGPLKAGVGLDFPDLRPQAVATDTVTVEAREAAPARDGVLRLERHEREDAERDPVVADAPIPLAETARGEPRSAPARVEERREARIAQAQDFIDSPRVRDPVAAEYHRPVEHSLVARYRDIEGQPHHAVSPSHPAYAHVLAQTARRAAPAAPLAMVAAAVLDGAEAAVFDMRPMVVPDMRTGLAIAASLDEQAVATAVAASAESPVAPLSGAGAEARERTESLAQALRIHGPVSATSASLGVFPATMDGPRGAGVYAGVYAGAEEGAISPPPVTRASPAPGQLPPAADPARLAQSMPANVMLARPTHPGELASALPMRADQRPSVLARPSPASMTHRADGAPPAPPIRVHADWSADGVRLWLGLDEPLQGQMAVIADQVRQWVRGQGTRLLSFTCNGRLLSGEHEPIPEPDEPASIRTHFEPREKKTWPSVR
ncbi:MAG TPA: hypothetical protein VLI46_03415 [Ramlibacter sp.]|nr:hypothetical protein [Ramlibacter sp.]